MNCGFFIIGEEFGSFDFLESIHIGGGTCLDLRRYLHGHCDIFSTYLNLKFNYKIAAIFRKGHDNRHYLIHAFNAYYQGGLRNYIDIRGYSSDINDILDSEFELRPFEEIVNGFAYGVDYDFDYYMEFNTFHELHQYLNDIGAYSGIQRCIKHFELFEELLRVFSNYYRL